MAVANQLPPSTGWTVISNHRQAVADPGSLRTVARAPDGVIEAIEADDERWFCLGIQWHPENMTASALDMQIFEALLDSAAGSPAVVPFKRKAA